MTLTRRTALGALAAPLIVPGALGAQAAGLEAVADRAEGLEQLHSLLILADGAEVLGIAPRGPGLDRPANLKSVSKTLLALLTGIAIERGVIAGVDAPVLPLLGRAPMGDARDEITVGHLLSMRAGLPSTSGPNYGRWVESEDWVDYVIEQDPHSPPGRRFTYSTGTWHVLGAALARAAGRDLHALAADWLARPLGVAIPPWEQDFQGRYLGGNQMEMSPRDLARVGEAVRRGGEGVIPEGWIDLSWRRRARSPWSGSGYGYGWFLSRLGGRFAAYGRGYGGQVLAVVPDLGMTAVVTSDPWRPARSGGHFGDVMRVLGAAADAVAARA